jgi:hypothetical protein
MLLLLALELLSAFFGSPLLFLLVLLPLFFADALAFLGLFLCLGFGRACHRRGRIGGLFCSCPWVMYRAIISRAYGDSGT